MTKTVAETLDLLAAYRGAATIRRVEEEILRLRREDAIAGSVHVSVGQEVAPIAVLSELTEHDRVLATYRGHGWALACGVPPVELLSEALQRATGTNGGRGGSAYLSAPAYRFVGENSIVGAGLPIANGVALGLLHEGHGGVAVVAFGDGATNQGASHEAIVFAIARSLPVIFVCENNGWSEMTPITETVPHATLAARAAAYGLPSFSVDGGDIVAVAATTRQAVARARSGAGPTFIEIKVPRLLGHYNADIEHYRSAEDREAHRARDPLAALRDHLEATDRNADRIAVDIEVEAEVAAAVEAALASPFPDPATARDQVTAHPEALVRPGEPVGAELAYGLAANRALLDEMAARPDMVMFGEDIATAGGTFGVTRNIRKQFGQRIFDTPIAEASILGAAVGASISGMRPVVEIMWTDFLMVAFDQIVNQAANVRYLSRGAVTAPLVIRMQQGAARGSCAQHSQSLEALLAHIPGIRVGMPATAHDAYSMLRAGIADPDPVVIIESRELYQTVGPVDLAAPVPPIGGARLTRAGHDVLIVTWGRITQDCLLAADRLKTQGIDASVLDLRWLAPLDEEAILAGVAANRGRVLIVHEANLTGGFGAEIAARIAERAFGVLEAPIRRLGAPDMRLPSSPVLRDALIPDIDAIVTAAREVADH